MKVKNEKFDIILLAGQSNADDAELVGMNLNLYKMMTL